MMMTQEINYYRTRSLLPPPKPSDVACQPQLDSTHHATRQAYPHPLISRYLPDLRKRNRSNSSNSSSS
ncbi:hypothetical protein VTJ04DRAFT_5595 [Mycothermus thermophilus]|uniref:uncharacterized protein n=1 Tax=Humicola insolens TaxID=85995 RepID=UPI0037431930